MGIKSAARDLLSELCEESALNAEEIAWGGTAIKKATHAAMVNAALGGIAVALALSEQDPEVAHRLALHIGVSPNYLTDPGRLVGQLSDALSAEAAPDA